MWIVISCVFYVTNLLHTGGRKGNEISPLTTKSKVKFAEETIDLQSWTPVSVEGGSEYIELVKDNWGKDNWFKIFLNWKVNQTNL